MTRMIDTDTLAKIGDIETDINVDTTPPFVAANRYAAIAEASGEPVINLSQGEPAHFNTPSVAAARCFSSLIRIDSLLNDYRVGRRSHADAEAGLMFHIETVIRAHYAGPVADELLEDLREAVTAIAAAAAGQGQALSEDAILHELLDYSPARGGRYPNRQSGRLLRSLLAEMHAERLGVAVAAEEIILTQGAAHAIALVFKALGEEGVGFLRRGDVVLVISPSYAPFVQMLRERGLTVVFIALDPVTGRPDAASQARIEALGARVKLILAINPNNPTGHPLAETLLEGIGELAERHEAVILSDEVYSAFFDECRSFAPFEKARKRWIRAHSLSKIERFTGGRVGDIWLSDEANEHLTGLLKADYLDGHYRDLRDLLYKARSFGGANIGAFDHITGLPGPSQTLATLILALGGEERERFVDEVAARARAFDAAMGLEHQGNRYYAMLDLEALAAPQRKGLSMEQRLTRLARRGLVLMPVAQFFAPEHRAAEPCRNWVRASLSNVSLAEVERAAEILRDELGLNEQSPARVSTIQPYLLDPVQL